jgi:DNA mismatch endonuclease (patch repair protein)
VLPRFNAVIFVHGCFWHRHSGCRHASTPTTRPDFWGSKFASNVTRDTSVRLELIEAGWRVATVWECALRTSAGIAAAGAAVGFWLRDERVELEVP